MELSALIDDDESINGEAGSKIYWLTKHHFSLQIFLVWWRGKPLVNEELSHRCPLLVLCMEVGAMIQ
jgi:hypothetical protein